MVRRPVRADRLADDVTGEGSYARLARLLAKQRRREGKIHAAIAAGLPSPVANMPRGRVVLWVRCAACGELACTVEDHDGFCCFRVGDTVWPILLPEPGLQCSTHGPLHVDEIHDALLDPQQQPKNLRVSPVGS